MELNKEKKMKLVQAVLPNPCLEEEEEEEEMKIKHFVDILCFVLIFFCLLCHVSDSFCFYFLI
jgi:hypothetical protein